MGSFRPGTIIRLKRPILGGRMIVSDRWFLYCSVTGRRSTMSSGFCVLKKPAVGQLGVIGPAQYSGVSALIASVTSADGAFVCALIPATNTARKNRNVTDLILSGIMFDARLSNLTFFYQFESQLLASLLQNPAAFDWTRILQFEVRGCPQISSSVIPSLQTVPDRQTQRNNLAARAPRTHSQYHTKITPWPPVSACETEMLIRRSRRPIVEAKADASALRSSHDFITLLNNL